MTTTENEEVLWRVGPFAIIRTRNAIGRAIVSDRLVYIHYNREPGHEGEWDGYNVLRRLTEAEINELRNLAEQLNITEWLVQRMGHQE